MARTYLEKFYFPLHVRFIEGDFYTKELSDEEVIEFLPYIQNWMNSIQEKEKTQEIVAKDINGTIPGNKVISASWEVMHRLGMQCLMAQ